ncbi:MAG: tetratricopeptide repeat protein [Prevotellaceae bacterium]|jgi:tetratricopeptide (TPR) repeat protein|nr:tetratricopeptide repeat protein [Prevotellaceae bacterium]
MKKKKNIEENLKEKEEREFSFGRLYGIASNTTEQAIEHYLNVLKINPDRIDVHFLLGKAYVQHAVRYFERVIAFNPDDADAHCYLGNAKATAGHCWHACRELEKVFEINPDDADACYDLSNNYRKTGEHDKAAEYLQKAMDIETKMEETLRNLPQASFAGMAQDNLPAATKIKKAKTLYNKGMAHQEQDNHTQAIKCFQAAIKANPACADACYRLALSYDKRRNRYLLQQYCLKAIEINPAHTDAWLKLANMVRDDDAIYLQYLQKVVEIEARDETIDEMIGIYKKRGDSEQVIACYQKRLEKHPGDTAVLDRFALEYRAQNQPEKAIDCFRKILENHPQYARAYVKMGYIYADMGDENNAAECFRQAEQLGNLRARAWLAGDEISKSRKAKFATLVKKCTWAAVEPVFVKEYPKLEKDTNDYDLIFYQLQNLTPVENGEDMSIHIHQDDHKYVMAYKNHPQTPEEDQTYDLSLTPWGDWLGMDIAGITIEDYSDEEIISHCLWEMTFYGYSQKSIQKEVEGWRKSEKETQEAEQKFPNVKKELKNAKKLKK